MCSVLQFESFVCVFLLCARTKRRALEALRGSRMIVVGAVHVSVMSSVENGRQKVVDIEMLNRQTTCFI